MSKPPFSERVMSVLPCILIAALVLVPVGIGLLSTINTTGKVTYVDDYSNCIDEDSGLACNSFTYALEHQICVCNFALQLKEDIIGDITLYYELDFDQTNATYANSRDEDQLEGRPGDIPAESCGAYRFDEENKPIFPCGEVADSIFNDTFFGLKPKYSKKQLLVSYTGILGETAKPYKNPPKEVLDKFVKPKNWPIRTPYWEKESNFTGVENEAFRVWMDTSLKRKPMWRLVPNENATNGLPAGNYTMRIDIYYPVNRYNGSRRIILEGVYAEIRTSRIVIGAFALILGLISMGVGLVLIVIFKRNEKSATSNDATLPVKKSNRLLTNDLEDISEELRDRKNQPLTNDLEAEAA